MLYNIMRKGRDDMLLGCSVILAETAMDYLKTYQAKYPQFEFYIVLTDDPGDMA